MVMEQKKRKRNLREGVQVQGVIEVPFKDGCYISADVNGKQFKGVLFSEESLAKRLPQKNNTGTVSTKAAQPLVTGADDAAGRALRSSTKRALLRLSSNPSNSIPRQLLNPFPEFLQQRLSTLVGCGVAPLPFWQPHRRQSSNATEGAGWITDPKMPQVVVVGAGMAGLACSLELQRLGIDVVLVEGRERVGGRVWTKEFSNQNKKGHVDHLADAESWYPPANVDLGAAWVHGVSGNPLTDMCLLAGLHLYDTQADMHFLDHDGQPIPGDVDKKMENEFNGVLDLVRGRGELMANKEAAKERQKRNKELIDSRPGRQRRAGLRAFSLRGQSGQNLYAQQRSLEEGDSLKNHRIGAHLSLGEVLDEVVKEKGEKHYTDQEMRLFEWHLANIEYSTASSIHNLSLRWWDQDDVHGFKGPHCIIKEGYGRLADLMATKVADLRLQFEVSSIIYNQEVEEPTLVHKEKNIPKRKRPCCLVRSADGRQIGCKAVVCTLPLGVLKKKAVEFEPPLPDFKNDAIQQLGYGLLNKVVLEFEGVFWDSKGQNFIGHAGKERGDFYLFVDLSHATSRPLLVAIVSAENAQHFENESKEETMERCVHTLRKLFGNLVQHPVSYEVTNWGKDRFALGSYSYIARGSTIEDMEALAKPLHNSLYFAGEATNSRYPASVHGAYLSGVREARRIHHKLFRQLAELPSPDEVIRGVKPGPGAVCGYCLLGETKMTSGYDSSSSQKGFQKGRGPGPLIGPFLDNKTYIWVHKDCAVYTPEVSYERGIWRSVVASVNRAKNQNCTGCRRRGATVGCYEMTCKKVYHPRCAVDQTAWDFCRSDQGKQFYCQKHRGIPIRGLMRMQSPEEYEDYTNS